MRPLCRKKRSGKSQEALRPYAVFPGLEAAFNVSPTPAPRRDRHQCSRLSYSLRRRCRPCDILRQAPEETAFSIAAASCSRQAMAQQRAGKSCPAGWRYCGPRCPARCRESARIQAARRTAQAGGRHHAQTARNRGALVGGEDVAEQVAGDHHVKLRRIENQLHRGVIHVHIADTSFRIFAWLRRSTVSRHRQLHSSVSRPSTAGACRGAFFAIPKPMRADARLPARNKPSSIRRRASAAPAPAEVNIAGRLAQNHAVSIGLAN